MKPTVTPLARSNRNFIFGLLVLIFLIALPAFMFYATGYRYDMFGASPSITVTGGLYVVATVDNAEVFINEATIRNARVFSNATFASGVVPGTHRVHVQAPLRHTWVKNMQVYPQFVTEAESFNLPLVPQVRVITRFETATGTAIVSNVASTTFAMASVTNPIFFTTATTSPTWITNIEYTTLEERFSALEFSTTTRTTRTLSPTIATTTTATTSAKTVVATTTVVKNNIALYEREGGVYARALTESRTVPYYFCALEILRSEATTTVQTSLSLALPDTYADIKRNLATCDREIKIDSLGQKIKSFHFVPDTNKLVLLHLSDGLYVVEIDDRFWQNAQLLYPGTDFDLLIDGNNIYVKEGDVLLEVFTDIQG